MQAIPHHVRPPVQLVIQVSCIAVQASSQLYMDAIDILADQEEGKEGLSGDLFRQAIGMHNFSCLLHVLPYVTLKPEALRITCRKARRCRADIFILVATAMGVAQQEMSLAAPSDHGAVCSWGDQTSQVSRSCGATDALCRCLRQAGLAALQSLPECSHHMALRSGWSTGLVNSAGPNHHEHLRDQASNAEGSCL